MIVSHDPERWNFSDSTDLSEVLLIATRRATPPPPPPPPPQGSDDQTEASEPVEERTTFVNLWRNDNDIMYAARAAQAIADTPPADINHPGASLLRVDDQDVGESVSIPTADFAGRHWLGIQFSRADLARTALNLINDGEVRIPGSQRSKTLAMRPLGKIARIGPDRRDILDGFDTTDSTTIYAAVWGNDSDERTSLTTQVNQYLSPLSQPRPGRKLKKP